MRIALINQAFHPDVVSSGQHLADLACRLAQRGHQVTVIASRRGYDDPRKVFPKRESWHGATILRISNTAFGKAAKWMRAANFATFLASCCWRLCRLPRQDVVLAMTSPPLVSVLAAWFARIRGARLCYWVMDLNPDEAVAAGWLAPCSLAAKWLERFSRFSLRQASAVVVLDQFMRKRILDKGIEERKLTIIPPWSHDSEVRFDTEGRGRFRKANCLENKFVVMYSGNHSPCNPLATVLAAAKQLVGHEEIAFCFVGGGAEFSRVKQFAAQEKLPNISCLPYQPLDELAGALSAADLHLVVLGDPFVGIVHPCKVYNILRVGAPLLYIGPKPSHVSEILAQVNGQLPWRRAGHAQADLVAQQILEFKQAGSPPRRNGAAPLANQFSAETLLPRLVALLESLACRQPVELARVGREQAQTVPGKSLFV
jgi:hypothetical protein